MANSKETLTINSQEVYFSETAGGIGHCPYKGYTIQTIKLVDREGKTYYSTYLMTAHAHYQKDFSTKEEAIRSAMEAIDTGAYTR